MAAELYVKSLSSGKKVWMGVKEDGERDVKPKVEVKTEADDQEQHKSIIDHAHQLPISPPNASISDPLVSILVGVPLCNSSSFIPPTSTAVSVAAEGQATMDGGDSVAMADKEKTVVSTLNELQKLKELDLAKERESLLKDQLLKSDALTAMWKEKYEQVEMKVKQMEKAAKITEKRGDATTMESAAMEKSARETAEQMSRATIAAQKLGVPLDSVEPLNEWKEKCEELERALENLRSEVNDEESWKTKYKTVKRLLRAEQKTTAALRRELREMGKEALEGQLVDDEESNEMVTSPLDPVQQLESQERRRQKQQQLEGMREGNATAAVSDGIQSPASGEQQEDSDGNVGEVTMKTAMGRSALGNRVSAAGRHRFGIAAEPVLASVVVKKKKEQSVHPANLTNAVAINGSFPCTECPQHLAFASAQLLEGHQQRRHSANHCFSCDQCAQSFTRKDHLNRHKEVVHGGVKPFTCPVCDRRFSLETNLKTHERVHTGERPYVCSDCEKAFKTSTNLRAHQRIHSGEKPYGCQFCGKKFNWSGHCWRHENTCSQRPK